MLIRRIDHTAVYVSHLDRSIAWYEAAFGLKHAYKGDTGGGEPGAFFDVGDTILAMLLTHEPTRNLAEQHFAFAVESADAAYEDLVNRGYKPVFAPEDLPSGYIAGQRYFDILDPDGVRIELVERKNISINEAMLHPEAAATA